MLLKTNFPAKRSILFLVLALCANTLTSQTCYPSFGNPQSSVYHLALNGIHNTASALGSGGVTVYPESIFTTKLSLGQSYQMQVLSNSQSGIGFTYSVWIDYNNDGLFSSGENIYTSSTYVHSIIMNIAVPADSSILGKRKIRIIGGSSNSTVNPCGYYNSGECEEYTIEFIGDSIPPAYCIPIHSGTSNSGSGKIESFSFHTLHNCMSGQSNPSYTHYPDSLYTTTLEMGKSYNLFVSYGTYAGVSVAVSAFLDYNNNHIFGPGETLMVTTDKISNTVVTIPFDSSFVGKRRLRIFSVKGYSPPAPCSSYSTGEVEDYDVTIIFPLPDTTTAIPNKMEKVFSISGNQTSNKIIETYDKGYLISGTHGTYNQYVNLIKTTIDGDAVSNKIHYLPHTYFASGLAETFDGGFVLAGSTTNGSNNGGIGFIKKFTPCRNPSWEKTYGSPDDYGYLRDVFQTSDSGFFASGSYLFPYFSNDTGRVGLLRTDKDGNQLWIKDHTYFPVSDVASFIYTSDNGGLLSVNGYTKHHSDTTPYFWRRGILTKVDSLGNLEWNLVLDTNNLISYVGSSVELSDKSFISAGFANVGNTNDRKATLFKFSDKGVLLSFKTLEYDSFYFPAPKVIRKINDNSFFLLCNDLSECDPSGYFPYVSLIVIDSNLNILVKRRLTNYSMTADDAIINSDGRIVVTCTKLTKNNYDIYMAKFNPETLEYDTISNVILTYDSLCDPTEGRPYLETTVSDVLISPNPATDAISVEISNYENQKYKLEVINSGGLVVISKSSINEKAVEVSLGHLPPGIYIIRVIFSDGMSRSKKLIKI